MAVDEEALLEAIKSDTTDASRLVYADWLEERGDTRRAEYVRLELELHRLGPAAKDPVHLERRQRRDELTLGLHSTWREMVDHAPPSDSEAQEQQQQEQPPSPQLVAKTWVAARPDGALLAVGDSTGALRIFDLERGGTRSTINFGDFITRASWTSSGDRLFVALRNGTLQIRSGDGLNVLRTLDTGHGLLRAFSLHHAEPRFLTCGEDGKAALWDLDSFARLLETKVPTGSRGPPSATSCALVPGAIVVGYSDGFFEAFTADADLKNIAGGEVLSGGVSAMCANASGDAIVLGGAKGSMLTLLINGKNWTAGNVWKGTPPRPIAVNAIDIATNGAFVAACSDGSARYFSSMTETFGDMLGMPFYLESPKPAWTEAFIISGACFVGATEIIATCGFNGSIQLWKGTTPSTLVITEKGFELSRSGVTITMATLLTSSS
jgi:uncharacterized protein (TIGR02996 family)